MMEKTIFRKKGKRRMAVLLAAALMMITAISFQSDAYFNRGTVSVSLGQSSIAMTAGSTASVSVSIDPLKQDQLPGCGMAECPQTCGDGCLNESGECTCAGTEYKTYYAEVSVTSSNSQTATASYSNGTLTVNAHSPGSAEITVTGQLRQYTDSSETLYVTVTNNSSGSTPSGSSGAPSSSPPSASYYDSGSSSPQQDIPDSSGSTSQGSVSVEDAGNGSTASDSNPSREKASAAQGISPDRQQQSPSSGNSGETEGEGQAAEAGQNLTGEYAPEGELRDTARGKYRFVVITASTDVPACFLDSANEGSHLVFQKKTGDNIDYSWTFNGENLNPEDDYSDMDLIIGSSSECPELLKKDLDGKSAFYMDFNYSGKLPAAAEIYMNVTDSFSEDQDLFLYQVNDLDGRLKELNDSVEMSNGYASFTLHHCSSYLLTDSAVKGAGKEDDGGILSSEDGLGLPLTLFILFSVLAAIAMIFFFFRKPKRR